MECFFFVELDGVGVVWLKLWQGEIEILSMFRRFDSFFFFRHSLEDSEHTWAYYVMLHLASPLQTRVEFLMLKKLCSFWWLVNLIVSLYTYVSWGLDEIPRSSCGVSFRYTSPLKEKAKALQPAVFAGFVGPVAYILTCFVGNNRFFFLQSHWCQRLHGHREWKGTTTSKLILWYFCDFHILASPCFSGFHVSLVVYTPCKAKTKDTLWTEIHRTLASIAATKGGVMARIAEQVLDESSDCCGTMWKFW